MTEIPKDKKYSFIISTGRTGTQYIGEYAKIAIQDCFSVHEPDMIRKVSDLSVEKIRWFGVYNLTIGRILGTRGIRNISNAYLSGKISDLEAYKKITKCRAKYYSNIPQGLVVESYLRWFGLVPPLVREHKKDVKFAAIVRDPRTWIISWINKGKHLTENFPTAKIISLLSPLITPNDIGDNDYSKRWGRMTSFEKFCWEWFAINNIILSYAERYPDNVKIFKYEDIFKRDESCIGDLLDFISTFPNAKFDRRDYALDLTDKRNSAAQVVTWDAIPDNDKSSLYDICGKLMTELGYKYTT